MLISKNSSTIISKGFSFCEQYKRWTFPSDPILKVLIIHAYRFIPNRPNNKTIQLTKIPPVSSSYSNPS